MSTVSSSSSSTSSSSSSRSSSSSSSSSSGSSSGAVRGASSSGNSASAGLSSTRSESSSSSGNSSHTGRAGSDRAEVSSEAREERDSDSSRASDLSSALTANFSETDKNATQVGAKEKVEKAGETAAQTAAGQYTVQSGDSVWSALRNAGFSNQDITSGGLVNKVAEASGLRNANMIRPGDVLNLPTPGGQNGEKGQLNQADINADPKLQDALRKAAEENGLPADAVPGVGSSAQSELVDGTNMRQGTLTLRDPNSGEVLGTYNFNNGGFGNGAIPDGTYQVSGGYLRNDKSGMISDGVGYSFVLTQQGMADGTADNPNSSTDRSLLRIHPDGNNPGTNGCIGIVGDAETQRAFYEQAQYLAQQGNGNFTLDFS